MSADELPEPDMDEPLRKALEHARLPEPRAEFREKLRAEFLAAPFEAKGAATVEEQDLGPAPIVAPRWGGPSVLTGRGAERDVEPPEASSRAKTPLWLRVATIAALAAAALFFFRSTPHQGWRVAPSSDFVVARVDGQSFTPKETLRLAAALVPGSLLEVEGGSIDLALDRRVALHLADGGALRFVVVPERDVLDAMLLTQERGSLAVVTGPDFTGSRLRVRTQDTEARVVGTEFAVDVLPGEGTCVCCASGSVQVFESAGESDPALENVPSEMVEAGRASVLLRAQTPAKHAEAQAAHVAPIANLRRIWAAAR